MLILEERHLLKPVGVNFDPEKLIDRFESGDPLEELVQLGSALGGSLEMEKFDVVIVGAGFALVWLAQVSRKDFG